MCSYNQIDGTFACENDHVMNELLKGELGFPGYIMTDWGAHHSTVESAIAGLDLSMPGTAYNGDERYWGENLINAVNGGSIPQERVDDMVTRILAAWYKTEQDVDFPAQVNLNADATSDAHFANVRATARDGTILLKNEGGILPLASPASIAVVGSGAVSGDHANNVCVDKGCNDGALGMGWGSGTVEYPYFVAPYDAINERATADGATVELSESDDPSAGASAASGADVALVFITSDSGEGYVTVEGHLGDRNDLNPWHGGNELVAAVAEANENVIVVVHSVGAVILSEILALPSVKGIVWAGLPSQESGNALVDILWGETSPSGKLPYTIAKSADDYNSKVSSGDDNYEDGVFVDYRHFDADGIEPEFEFGFGLCNYTLSVRVFVCEQDTNQSFSLHQLHLR
jgi:beta-glucosidase